MNENKPIVLYHYPCADGFTAAWIIWKEHPDWEFKGMKYGDTLPDLTGRHVYFVDFTVKYLVLKEVATKAASIVILDHHKTAEADLKDLPSNVHAIFDMNKSGARIAWEYFNGGNQASEPPRIVTYVEDRDLWRFNYSATRAVSAYIFSHQYDFATWDDVAYHLEKYEENIIAQGEAIERKHFKDVDELAQIATRTTMSGYEVPIVNVPYTYASDLLHKLAKNEPFAVSWYYDGPRQKYIYSLRSAEDGVDVSEIAKKYGGGGHLHAAGFESNYNYTY